ncbi:AAA family ATPase [Dolichospermum circinale]|uniref:AAA family ATPase n=1 Tax=Dolichospermum circinale TaxID=109265 RepID=UPI002330C195|nr:ATP-binding protein [Dolichospermum circinale]MDB9453663.1 ATP-binding protein [Dolichospermum circinale CS-541/06]MDB9462701.1 ATP-binding protein [Dolichospermum circinale CS-541/04]MDB9549048.1 ATP-binding protein [Dolichospermum circinale CS-1031]
MKIQSFKFSNNKENWHIEEVKFESLNLLVGGSGVGKTRILKALDLICDVAKGRNRNLDNLEWSINFSHLGKNYRWKLKSSSTKKEEISLNVNESEQTEIVYEKLVRYDDDSELEILLRTDLDSKFNNEKLPKLKRTESAITLLSEEDLIIPVGKAFERLIFNFETRQQLRIGLGSDPSKIPVYIENDEIQNFKEYFANFRPVVKAFYLQKFFPDVFNEIKEYYIDIFSEVNDVRVSSERTSDGDFRLFLEIKENGVEDWIPQERISSGMFRTLIFLVEVITAPEESVILIDEFENSLGINCMAELTDFILDKSPDVQFILTSHHPYIINNIPWDTWQIVSKSGNKVRVRKSLNIPELNTASSLDKFTQLVNLLDSEKVSE